MSMTMHEGNIELRWHSEALTHALERREELIQKYGSSLPHRGILMEFIDRLDEDIRWHEGRIRELETEGQQSLGQPDDATYNYFPERA